MNPASESSSSAASHSSSGGAPKAALGDSPWRWLPLTWQLGGGLVTIYGFSTGGLQLSDVGLNLSILGGITVVYLLAFIREDHRRQDFAAAFGYSMWAAGFALISLPDRFNFGAWTPGIYTLGALAITLLLPLTWMMYVEWGRDEHKNQP